MSWEPEIFATPTTIRRERKTPIPALLAAAIPSLLTAGASVTSTYLAQRAQPAAYPVAAGTSLGPAMITPTYTAPTTPAPLLPPIQWGQPTAPRAGRRSYSIFRDKGRLIDAATGRTIGYTPQSAKKRFKTKRRRKRLSKRDIYILETLKQQPAASAALAML